MPSMYIRWLIISLDFVNSKPPVHLLIMKLSGIITNSNSNSEKISLEDASLDFHLG